jgi:threonyl-tRNA synthetase
MQRIPYLLVLGEREAAEGAVTVRNVITKKQETVPLSQFVASLLTDIRERRLQAAVGA